MVPDGTVLNVRNIPPVRWPVPNYSEYRYAVVNDRRVIVEPRTRKIVKIID